MGSSVQKTLLLRANNSGFFSNLNCVLSHLRFTLGRHGAAATIVDWRARADRSNFPYGTSADGNLWPHFFEPLAFELRPGDLIETHLFARRAMTARRAYAMYKLDSTWRQIYGRLFQRYIRVKPEIQARADALHNTTMAGHYRVGVHCRHPNHDSECLHRSPSLRRYIAAVRALLPADRSWVVFLATDYEPAVAAFRSAFGERLVIQSGVRRALATGDEQMHHGNSEPGVELGEQVLIDALLLARCDAFVHVTSNLATAVGYMNPETRMVYCDTKFQALLGYLWSLYELTPLARIRGSLLERSRIRRHRQATARTG